MEGLVFCNGKFGYRFLPKTASTTIKHALYEIETGEKYNIKEKGIHLHDYLGDKYYGDISSCEYRFIVIRDPIKRFLSAFKNRVSYHRELSESFIKDKYRHLYWKIPHFNPGLGQFIDNLKPCLLVTPIFHHLRPFSDFIGESALSDFTHVYKFEDLLQFEVELSRLVGKKITFAHLQAGGKKKFKIKDLNRRQMKKLIRFYRKDYKLLKDFYSVEELWEEWAGQRHDPDFPKSFPDVKKPSVLLTVLYRLRKLFGT